MKAAAPSVVADPVFPGFGPATGHVGANPSLMTAASSAYHL
jgi:hypothetical protein